MSLVRWGIAGVLACSLSVAACGGDDKKSDDDGDSDEGGDVGPTTGAVCNKALTYETDIAPLMTKYCISCHATNVPVAQRYGAPTDHNFETEAGVLKETKHIDEEAGSGPSATNTAMPPVDILKTLPVPTTQERQTLSAWIACQPLM